MSRTELYHYTRAEFAAFADDAPGTRDDSAENAALGIWFFAERRHAERMADGADGGHVIVAEVDLGRPLMMTVAMLQRLSWRLNANMDSAAARSEWRAMRRRLLDDGYDSVAIVEQDGSVGMHVVLRAASIITVDHSYHAVMP